MMGLKEMFEIDEIWATLDKGQWMTLSVGTDKSSCIHVVDFMCKLSDHRLQIVSRKLLLKCVPYKHIREQILPCCKKGQGQPRVIIWTNLEVLKYFIVHTNFQGHRPSGSREEDILRLLPYMVMWPWPFEQTTKFGFHRPSGFREEDV